MNPRRPTVFAPALVILTLLLAACGPDATDPYADDPGRTPVPDAGPESGLPHDDGTGGPDGGAEDGAPDAGEDGAAGDDPADGGDGGAGDGGPDAGSGDEGTGTGETSTDPGDGEGCRLAPDAVDGVATFYAFTSLGACGFQEAAVTDRFAALGYQDLDAAAACGTCLDVTGPHGTVRVLVADLCPECPPGHIDLAPGAFAEIAQPSAGYVPVQWRRVPCEVDGPLRFQFEPGSNPWWWAVRVLDHPQPIAEVARSLGDGEWEVLPRMEWNVFVAEPPDGDPGPYDLRITDVSGNVALEYDLPLASGEVVQGDAQLPICSLP